MPTEPLIIVTGISGAGKSSMIAILEDMGYFCADNLPSQLLDSFVDTMQQTRPTQKLMAVGMDVRLLDFTADPTPYLKNINKRIHAKIYFLEAREDILVRRYSETRRVHPVAPHGNILAGIRRERELMLPIRKIADRIIDTSALNIHELKSLVRSILTPHHVKSKMSVVLLSFGYKYGIPLQTDLTLDVRFLPNPYFIPALKNLTGKSIKVKHHVLKHRDTKIFIKKIMDLLTFLIKNYEREGKAYLTIALGCTGGKHRSVALVEEFNKLLRRKKIATQVEHRDINK